MHGMVGVVPVGLVDHKDIADFQYSRLDGLDVVTEARHHNHHRSMRHAGNIDLILADPYGLDYDNVHSHGVKNIDDVAGRAGHSPQLAAGRHTPDKYPCVLGMAVHADAVPE